MASGMDIWGAIASAIGVLSTIQIILTIIHGRLPSQYIRLFEQTLKDTEALLDSVSEEGLFDDDGHYVAHAKTRISNICERLEGLREESFEAKTYKEELRQWWRGLSGRISVCNDELKELRAEISVTSSEARTALAQQRQNAGSNEPPVPGGDSDSVPVTRCVLDGNSHAAGSANYCSIETDNNICTPPEQLMQQCQIREGECKDDSEDTTPAKTESSKSSDSEAALCRHGTPQSPLRSDSADTLPPYRRQTIPPSYPQCVTSVCPCSSASTSESPVIRTTSLLSRCTAADSARATRKLVKAFRRNLMVHNVPWKLDGAQHPLHGPSAAASARAIDRPSNNMRHWKLLEARSRTPLRSYIAVLSHEAIIDASPHTTGTEPA